MKGIRPLRPHRTAFAGALLFALLLAACDRAAPPAEQTASVAATPAAPPDLAGGPVTATVSADGRTLTVGVAERSIEASAADFFDDRASKFDKATILAQGKRDDVYQVLVSAEAASDPKRDGGRCRDGREVVFRHLEFDVNSMSSTSTNDVESCLRRLRVVAQRRSADGGFEYDLEEIDADGDPSSIYLRYDGKDYGRAAAR
ncbi:hypothetical protein [Lysobacter enzymogenes]|uniref:Lipoprotein n=1 Tax=Lysobacter enzymogenes TaxID=69 RepID=A0A3N2RBC7_LYSEN|nr:hypothetical protein [Lysobacter enzymogenes]ROU04713.1 hypothetical protein D9T17_21515 [Lysobacter enzymogenes]